MARTKQVAHKISSPVKVKREKANLETNPETGEVKIKTEKIEIVKPPGSEAKKIARKLLTPRRFDSERRKLIEQDFIFPHRPFSALIREIANDIAEKDYKDVFPNGVRFEKKAVHIIQKSAEEKLEHLFQDCAMLAENSNRSTVLKKDMQCVMGIYDRCRARPLSRHEKELSRYLLEKLNREKARARKMASNTELQDDVLDSDSDEDYKEESNEEEEKASFTCGTGGENVLINMKIKKEKKSDKSDQENAVAKKVSAKSTLPRVVMIKKEKDTNSFSTSGTVDPSDL